MKLLRYLSPVTTFSLCTLASLASITTATAQIIPDSSLGAESSVVNPDVINGIPSDRIDGGAIRGSNLFHSFQEFNVGAGRGAYFSNPANITNILTRVTGGNPSNILGKLGVLGNANLFLLNPKGIYFGPNASLDLNGSFFGTTADSFIFNNNFEFSATNPQAVPLLSVNIPIGLRFRDNPGNITNNANTFGLEVQPGNSLALVGGNVSFNNGKLTAPGGRVELGGVGGTGTVGLNVNSNNVFLILPNNPAQIQISAQELFLSYPDNITKADISAYQSSVEGNSIQLQGKQITLSAGSSISARDFSSLNLLTGNPITYVESPQGGNIIINADKLSVRDGSRVGASLINRFSVSGAKLTVTTSDSVEVSGTGIDLFGRIDDSSISVFSLNNTSEELTISTKKLIVRDGGKIIAFAARNNSQGGGTLTINASDSVELTGISKERFSGFILLNDFSEDGRSISGIFSTVFNVGDAGNITVNTKRLLIQDGARISASTFSIGKAGNININASDSVELNGTSADGLVRSGLFATSTFSSGGNITIKTGQLSVQNRAQVNVAAEPTPRNIQIGITEFGSAGNIDIRADNIQLNNQAVLDANSFYGAGGNISLQAEDILLLRRNSKISATSGTPGSTGQDGNINVNTKFLVAFPSENSDIVATGFGRSVGSNIQIDAKQGIFGIQYRPTLTTKSDIVATGSVGLFTFDTQDASQVLPELPQNPTDPSNQIAQNPCQKGSGSSFVFIGRGGLPSSPNDGFSNNETRVDLVEPVASSSNSQAAITNQPVIVSNTNKRIIPAQGWIFNSKGEVVLTAYDPTATSTAQRNSKPTAACPAF